MHLAYRKGHVSIAESLFEKVKDGTVFQQPNGIGETPIDCGVQNLLTLGYETLAQLYLIEWKYLKLEPLPPIGADADLRAAFESESGIDLHILMLYLARGDMKSARKVLEENGDLVYIRDFQGYTVLDRLLNQKIIRQDIVQLLLEYLAPLKPLREQMTPESIDLVHLVRSSADADPSLVKLLDETAESDEKLSRILPSDIGLDAVPGIASWQEAYRNRVSLADQAKQAAKKVYQLDIDVKELEKKEQYLIKEVEEFGKGIAGSSFDQHMSRKVELTAQLSKVSEEHVESLKKQKLETEKLDKLQRDVTVVTGSFYKSLSQTNAFGNLDQDLKEVLARKKKAKSKQAAIMKKNNTVIARKVSEDKKRKRELEQLQFETHKLEEEIAGPFDYEKAKPKEKTKHAEKLKTTSTKLLEIQTKIQTLREPDQKLFNNLETEEFDQEELEAMKPHEFDDRLAELARELTICDRMEKAIVCWKSEFKKNPLVEILYSSSEKVFKDLVESLNNQEKTEYGRKLRDRARRYEQCGQRDEYCRSMLRSCKLCPDFSCYVAVTEVFKSLHDYDAALKCITEAKQEFQDSNDQLTSLEKEIETLRKAPKSAASLLNRWIRDILDLETRNKFKFSIFTEPYFFDSGTRVAIESLLCFPLHVLSQAFEALGYHSDRISSSGLHFQLKLDNENGVLFDSLNEVSLKLIQSTVRQHLRNVFDAPPNDTKFKELGTKLYDGDRALMYMEVELEKSKIEVDKAQIAFDAADTAKADMMRKWTDLLPGETFSNAMERMKHQTQNVNDSKEHKALETCKTVLEEAKKKYDGQVEGHSQLDKVHSAVVSDLSAYRKESALAKWDEEQVQKSVVSEKAQEEELRNKISDLGRMLSAKEGEIDRMQKRIVQDEQKLEDQSEESMRQLGSAPKIDAEEMMKVFQEKLAEHEKAKAAINDRKSRLKIIEKTFTTCHEALEMAQDGLYRILPKRHTVPVPVKSTATATSSVKNVVPAAVTAASAQTMGTSIAGEDTESETAPLLQADEITEDTSLPQRDLIEHGRTHCTEEGEDSDVDEIIEEYKKSSVDALPMVTDNESEVVNHEIEVYKSTVVNHYRKECNEIFQSRDRQQSLQERVDKLERELTELKDNSPGFLSRGREYYEFKKRVLGDMRLSTFYDAVRFCLLSDLSARMVVRSNQVSTSQKLIGKATTYVEVAAGILSLGQLGAYSKLVNVVAEGQEKGRTVEFDKNVINALRCNLLEIDELCDLVAVLLTYYLEQPLYFLTSDSEAEKLVAGVLTTKSMDQMYREMITTLRTAVVVTEKAALFLQKIVQKLHGSLETVHIEIGGLQPKMTLKDLCSRLGWKRDSQGGKSPQLYAESDSQLEPFKYVQIPSDPVFDTLLPSSVFLVTDQEELVSSATGNELSTLKKRVDEIEKMLKEKENIHIDESQMSVENCVASISVDWDLHNTIHGIVESMSDLSSSEWKPSKVPNAENSWVERFGQLRLVNVPGDGHCQFRVLADILFGDENRYREVRRGVAAHMLENAQFDEKAYIDVALVQDKQSYSNLEEFCKAIGEGKEWGNNATLQAASNVYNVSISVLSSVNGGSRFNLIQPNGDKESLGTVYVGHLSEFHFFGIMLK